MTILSPFRYQLLFLLIFIPFTAATQPKTGSDIWGSSDHKILNRYPESIITHYRISQEAYPYLLGDWLGSEDSSQVERIQGTVTRISYLLNDEIAPSRVLYYFEEELKEKGFEILYQTYSLKDLHSFINTTMPDSIVNGNGPQNKQYNYITTGISAYLVAEKDDGLKTQLMTVAASENKYMRKTAYSLDLVEYVDTNILKGTIDADYINNQLETQGKVAIYGISFKPGTDTLMPVSDSSIAIVADYLRKSDTTKIIITGHTLQMEDLEVSLDLSEKRARRVTTVLEEKFLINSGRLIYKGLGFLSPIYSNSDLKRRKYNERIELVKLK
jgi:outer membrane protein OmpA-like peptidoglycan-associated protein